MAAVVVVVFFPFPSPRIHAWVLRKERAGSGKPGSRGEGKKKKKEAGRAGGGRLQAATPFEGRP